MCAEIGNSAASAWTLQPWKLENRPIKWLYVVRIVEERMNGNRRRVTMRTRQNCFGDVHYIQ